MVLLCLRYFRVQTPTFLPRGMRLRQKQAGLFQHGIIWLSTPKGVLGIEITGTVEFEGARFFFIRDPDKNVIEFHQPAKR